ncbi:MAG: NAD(P)H-binding protein [Chloroflexi bacterium]|nr:NAD(P)H-binding protein [Chloroflexota bacterium]
MTLRRRNPTFLNAVTGAFGYIGKYITRQLLDSGESVRTLTGHPRRQDPFGGRVKVFPLDFAHPTQLVESLRGVTTLYNTYWVRFPRGRVTFETAVANSGTLVRAARQAGVRRIVHISITNASADSPLPYFRGKGRVEQAIIASGLSYAIVRPTVVFGLEDILINNIAWHLRRFPAFAVFGRGDCRVQPVYVKDVAQIAAHSGHRTEDLFVDAVGPETYTFDQLVRLIGRAAGSRARVLHLPPDLGLWLARFGSLMLNDVIITRDEIRGLMANLLVSAGPVTGRTRLSDWLAQNARGVGARYASELQRHYR